MKLLNTINCAIRIVRKPTCRAANPFFGHAAASRANDDGGGGGEAQWQHDPAKIITGAHDPRPVSCVVLPAVFARPPE